MAKFSTAKALGREKDHWNQIFKFNFKKIALHFSEPNTFPVYSVGIHG